MKTITITGGRPGDMLVRTEGSVEIGGVLTEPEKLIVSGPEMMHVSDGYHTFDELYDHRITLFIALCRHMHELLGMEKPGKFKIWRSKRHSDGELCFGTGTQYVLGIGTDPGQQITYHIPIARWNETDFVDELDRAPKWDGHTPADVLARLKTL